MAYPDEATQRLVSLVSAYLRAPSGASTSDAGEPVLEFAPPLDAAEQVVFADLLRMARSHITGLSFAEFVALDADLAALRAFRQQSQAEFMALTATQRDRALFDVVNAQTNVLRALLRD